MREPALLKKSSSARSSRWKKRSVSARQLRQLNLRPKGRRLRRKSDSASSFKKELQLKPRKLEKGLIERRLQDRQPLSKLLC